jgi:hypothetical protein
VYINRHTFIFIRSIQSFDSRLYNPYLMLMTSLRPIPYPQVVMARIPFIASAGLFAAVALLKAGDPCSLSGITRNADGQPLGDVQITVRAAGTGDRTVTSASDGAFCVANLAIGKYELTAKAEGIGSSAPTSVDVSDPPGAPVDVAVPATAPPGTGLTAADFSSGSSRPMRTIGRAPRSVDPSPHIVDIPRR